MPLNVEGYEITNKNARAYEKSNIVQGGLVLHLDASIFNTVTYGTTWFDLSGNGNNGTITNGPAYSSSNGGIIDFDGTNDTVDLSIDLLKDFSLECWVNYDVINGFSFFGQGPTALNQGLHIWNTSSSSIRFGMYGNDTDYYSLSLSTGTWYHFVFTYNHSSPFNKQMFLNGVEQTGSEIQAQSQYTGTGNFRIGATYGSGSFAFANGKFSSTKIYNRILSSTEIAHNYNVTKGRFGL